MRLTLVALVLAVLGVACSPAEEVADDSTTSSTSATTTTVASTSVPADGSTVVVGVLEVPDTLNPVAPGGTRPASTLVQQASLPGAFVYDPVSWRTIPDLVVRIPSAAEGDVTVFGSRQDVTWTIRPEATWSDGTPVSGADFAFTLRATFGDVECAGGSGSASFFGFTIVDIADKSITIEMPGPSPMYETMFSAVLPAHATDGASVCTDDGAGWPSAGPFVVDALDADHVRLTRNDAYWGDTPAYDVVDIIRHDDEAVLADAVIAGSVDVAVVSSSAVAAMAGDAGVDVMTEPSGRLEHLAFDFRSGDGDAEALLGVLEFRQGVARAIDTAAIAAELGWVPLAGVARTATPPTPWDVYGYDVDEARRLIAVGCEEAGIDCTATPPRLRLLATDFGDRPVVVDRVVADLEAAGLAVQVDQVSSTQISDRIGGGEWDVAVLSLTEPAGVSAAATWLFGALDSDSGRNVYQYGGPGSLAAAERAAFQLQLFAGQFGVAPDPDRAGRLLGEMHELLAKEVVFVPLVASPRFTLVGEGVTGVVPNASPSGVTWNIGRWSPATG